MRVPVSSSIRVNGLQNVRPPATAGIGNAQRIDRSHDNVTASVSETTEDAQDNGFGNVVALVLEDVVFAYNDIIARSNEAVIGRLISYIAAMLLRSRPTQTRA